jgi:hypothetical protein
MPHVVITPAAMDTLPPVCVLTGRTDDVVFRAVTFSSAVALPNACAVMSRCEVLLPFQRAAWRAFARRRAAMEIAAAAGVVLLAAAVAAPVEALRVTAGLLALACALVALVAWRGSRAVAPRLEVLAEDGLRLDVPSADAARELGRYVEQVEVECRRAQRRALKVERKLAKLRGSPLLTPR